MKKWVAASLVEHPGHGDQSVHGRRGGIGKYNLGGTIEVGPSSKGYGKVSIGTRSGYRVHDPVSPASYHRAARVKARGEKAGRLASGYSQRRMILAKAKRSMF